MYTADLQSQATVWGNSMKEYYFRREVNYRRVEEFWVRDEGDWVDWEELTVVDSQRPPGPRRHVLDVGKPSRTLPPGTKSPSDSLEDDPTSR